MSLVRWTLIALVLAAGAAAADQDAPSLVAVLEIRNDLPPQERAQVPAAYLTDRLRAVILERMPRFRMLTRENILVLLQAQGKSLEECEGACEIDTGRLLGADLIVSGELLRFGSGLRINLKLHDVRSGLLLAGAVASAPIADELEKALSASLPQLLGPLDLRAPGPAIAESRRPTREGPWYVGLDGGWVTLVDGPTRKGMSATLRGGYRMSPRLALEAGIDWRSLSLENQVELAASGGSDLEAGWAFVGAELSLVGPRILAIAGAIGAGAIDSHLYFDGAPGVAGSQQRQTSFGPLANVEIRLALPLGRVDLGLAGGMTAFYLGTVPPPIPAAQAGGGNVSLEATEGLKLEPRLSAFLRFAL